MNKNVFVVIFLFLSLSFTLKATPAPKVKYWIKLKDKNGTPFSVSNPSAFLSQKAISRRTTYSVTIDALDLPITPSYMQQIDQVLHVDVVYASKWLNGLMVVIDSNSVAQAALSTIKSFAFVMDTVKVKFYKLVLPPAPAIPAVQEKVFEGLAGNAYLYGGSNGQIRQLNVDCLHNRGFRGQGITIGVMDVGFTYVDTNPVFDSIRNSGAILGTKDFVGGGTNVYQGGTHGTMVLSCMAANKPGTAIGTAPKSNYWLFRTEDVSSETLTEEYNWVRAAEYADSVGVDLLTTSLGYTEFDNPIQNHSYATLNGRTAPMSIAATIAARKGLFVLNAAGNEGQSAWKYISVPGDADSICTVGAVDTLGNLAGFSSVGPTADGRIKPDLVACGSGAWVCEQSVCFPGNGTSFATPILAGAVACFWQSNKTLNNMKLLDSLRKTASNTNSPNNFRGWGIPNLCKVSATPTLQIKGKAFLEGEIMHQGIWVKCIPLSFGAKRDSVLSDVDGAYSLILLAGTYQLQYSKAGFSTYNSSVTLSGSLYQLPNVTLLNSVYKPFDFTIFSEINSSVISLKLSKLNYNSIQVEIMDLVGRLLFSSEIKNVETTIWLNASILSDGIYLARVKTSEGVITKKFLKK